ncbi:hypothetical protein ScPMuIL_013035 [Solemya velum]
MAYRFTSSRQLHQLLDNVENVQKDDITSYTRGHLNPSNLTNSSALQKSKYWKSAHEKSPSMLQSCSVLKELELSMGEMEETMKDVLFDFSVGTSGSIPNATSNKKSPQKYSEQFHEQSTYSRGQSDMSDKSLYTQIEDGILIEELKPQTIMLPSPRSPLLHRHRLLHSVEEDYDIMNDLSLGRDGMVTFRHSFVPTYVTGITKKDQYVKMKGFESQILRKQDTSEQRVFSGRRNIAQLEQKVQQELNMMNLNGIGPNFHRLQVFSNAFEELLEETTTFEVILKNIKTEYDCYIAKLLDAQNPQHSHMLRDQVENMMVRGTSRPQELREAKTKVFEQEAEAKLKLKRNGELRKEVSEEEEWLANAPEPESPQVVTSVYHDDVPAELADEIEHAKALIMEKLDAVNDLRSKLREDYVPLTVCNHLEQCIKETEVEVQKLLKQNEYFERSIGEMDSDLKDAIVEADTSERDARRIWRKVNSLRGLPCVHLLYGSDVTNNESEEEGDDESKWSWYIS